MPAKQGVDWFFAANQFTLRKLIETCLAVCANQGGRQAAQRLLIQELFYRSFEGPPT
jgi:hypothetical protein